MSTLPATLAANPRLDRWVSFLPNGRVRIATGKVEYGQGAMTAIAQIGAEELDVTMAQVSAEEPSTLGPNEGLTVGSMSVEMSGASVRQACAEVRALILAAAAAKLKCSADALTVGDGAILRDGKPTGETYWTLAAAVDLARDADGERAAPKPASTYTLVGQEAARVDLPAKVFGGAFIHDIALPGMLHARVLRQPSPGAKLKALDEAAIKRAAKGDVAIWRNQDFVAFLSADEAAARRAHEAALQRAEWEGGRTIPAGVSEAASLRDAESEQFDTGAPKAEPSNRRRITARYSKPYIAHGSMGPSCGIAQFKDGRLTMWVHSQGVFPIRGTIARGLGVDETLIDVRHEQGPGNYGHNGSDDAAFDAAVLAMAHPGAPIRVLWPREDEFAHAPVGTAMDIELTAELDEQGRIADYTAEIWSGRHTNRGRALAERALPPAPPSPPPPAPIGVAGGGMMRFSGALLNARPSYDIGPSRVIEHEVTRTPVRTSSLRGLGGPPNEYAGECFMDELADAAGEDPLAFRLNMLSDPRSRRVLMRAAELAEWPKRGERGTGQGLGLSFCIHRNRGAYVACVAAVTVETEIKLDKIWCVADAGLIVNPDGAKNQIEGGIIMAASWLLKEQVKLGGHGIESTTWDDYPILRFDEIPELVVELIPAQDKPPMGVGEISSGPAMAAIGNAVAHALGARIRELPMTRERVAAALLA